VEIYKKGVENISFQFVKEKNMKRNFCLLFQVLVKYDHIKKTSYSIVLWAWPSKFPGQ
jgi:hypothetical protein